MAQRRGHPACGSVDNSSWTPDEIQWSGRGPAEIAPASGGMKPNRLEKTKASRVGHRRTKTTNVKTEEKENVEEWYSDTPLF